MDSTPSEQKTDYGGKGSWLPSNAASSSKVGVGDQNEEARGWGGGGGAETTRNEGSSAGVSLDSGGGTSSPPGAHAVRS